LSARRYRLGRVLALAAAAAALAACDTADVAVRPVFKVGGERLDTLEQAYEIGKTHLAAGRPGLAVVAFQTALARDGGSAPLLNALGAAYDMLRRFDLAERYYGQAMGLDEHDSQTLNNRGFSRLLRGDRKGAQPLLVEANRLDPTNPVIQGNLQLAERRAPAPAELLVAGDEPRVEPGRFPRIERVGPAEHQLLLSAADVTRQLATALPLAVTARIGDADEPGVLAAPRVAVQVESLQPAPVPPAAPSVASAAAVIVAEACAPAGRLEIANGVGRTAMAARMRAYLGQRGVEGARLTNAGHFDQGATALFYRAGCDATARRLAALLPVAPVVQPAEAQDVPLRLVIGRDLLDFDRQLEGRDEAYAL
jgi:tetratricopeptide (TPR) repeat protein